MTIDLGEFHTQVAGALKRGSTVDALIPSYVERTARRIEKNYTYLYMEKFAEFIVDASASFPRTIQLPAGQDLTKTIEMLRWIDSTDFSYNTIFEVDPRRITQRKTAAATGYWRQGNDFLILDNKPDVNYDYEIIWSEYTDWPTDLNAAPWLVKNEVSLLMAETLLEFAGFLRDKDMRAEYQAQRDIAYKESIKADEDIRASNSDATTGYTAFRGER